jgi:signal transduction histidine kinase
MSMPDEQKGNGETSRTAKRIDYASVLSGTPLPSMDPARPQETTSSQTEQPLVELLASLSHEFRTPLSVIKGYTSMLLHQAQLLSQEEQRDSLQMIQEAGNRLEGLTGRLLEIAQLEAGTFQIDYSTVDIPSVAREAIGSAHQQVPDSLRDRLTLHLQCRDEHGNQTQEVPAVRGDIRCLRKVLGHLLENAIRFSPQGGKIDVIARPAPQERSAAIEDQPLDGSSFLELCVCDYGVGIAPEHLERIFERFYRVDTALTREVNGLGLGLTACKYLIALHHGRIWAESCSAGGSAFHVWLPLQEPTWRSAGTVA